MRTRSCISIKALAMAITIGVFPLPPAVRFPTQITVAGERYGVAFAALSATVAPYAHPNGASTLAASFAPMVPASQNSGARIGKQCFDGGPGAFDGAPKGMSRLGSSLSQPHCFARIYDQPF